MGEYVEFTFDDGQSVLLEVMPSPLGAGNEAEPGSELLKPYARMPGRDRVSRATRGALRIALRPLVPVLESVRQTTDGLAQQPDEVSVEVGVRITDDLRLGIVGIKGEASLVVKATWKSSAG
ncbi:CU044_2847 family protein [Streptomyces sp. NPDC001492]